MTDQLDLICQRLLRPVPAPWTPPPQPATTWKKLKVCDVLILRVDYRLPATNLPAGQRLRVARVDTQGVTLTGEPWDFEWRWTDPHWESTFEKQQPPKKTSRRAKKVVDTTPPTE